MYIPNIYIYRNNYANIFFKLMFNNLTISRIHPSSRKIKFSSQLNKTRHLPYICSSQNESLEYSGGPWIFLMVMLRTWGRYWGGMEMCGSWWEEVVAGVGVVDGGNSETIK